VSRPQVLVVEDDREMRLLLQDELRENGYDVLLAASGREALETIETQDVDIVVTDLVMPEMKGLDLLGEIRNRGSGVPVVIMTAFGSIESAVESMRGGAYYYITKPFRIDQLVGTVEAALRDRALTERLAGGAGAARGADAIVTESVAMHRVLDLLARAAPSEAPVLILGESGTGKELLARTLHARSPRADRPFLAINCAAIPEGLLESQLFGHRRGTFTDAREDRQGLFQEAKGGTVFLDEIGDMPHSLQAKILRVLQEKEVHPIGAPAPVPVDVRVVASTHRDLAALTAEGRFRQDLYYRLNVIAIHVPPLRQRPDDVVPLVAHFLEKHGARHGRKGCGIALEALERLRTHAWPGNVRELENVIERALVLGRGETIGVEDLPENLRRFRGAAPGAEPVRTLADMEREQIVRALRSVRGNKAAAARLLGLDRKTLYRKLVTYGIADA
jgi:two-component system response regulator HydG